MQREITKLSFDRERLLSNSACCILAARRAQVFPWVVAQASRRWPHGGARGNTRSPSWPGAAAGLARTVEICARTGRARSKSDEARATCKRLRAPIVLAEASLANTDEKRASWLLKPHLGRGIVRGLSYPGACPDAKARKPVEPIETLSDTAQKCVLLLLGYLGRSELVAKEGEENQSPKKRRGEEGEARRRGEEQGGRRDECRREGHRKVWEKGGEERSRSAGGRWGVRG